MLNSKNTQDVQDTKTSRLNVPVEPDFLRRLGIAAAFCKTNNSEFVRGAVEKEVDMIFKRHKVTNAT